MQKDYRVFPQNYQLKLYSEKESWKISGASGKKMTDLQHYMIRGLTILIVRQPLCRINVTCWKG